ncbi:MULTISPECIES: DUF1810 domain-containing protein [unclassified Curtobacterium]|uniref:DUF1810 domain-containing protein n=1 Tax=unclassified Curtobacterium TaxID=257496 RepID=UPI00052A3D4E|nr:MULTISPECIES: DUF1810 domain-containing protein [unclassified Curtobacterium]AIV40612.1 calpastatin [Curtobacterium sp. MR_MD2014]MBP1302179.1 uncharacterized protein (DUF1810 family) [Curtobacterium sp. 1310]MCM3504314.1 DUF1810 domain-containing protein [Curtobacterium sp. ODYSSEY 48 V2]MCM3520309.1 DUF1810 domain-containing protein [Curtobacterium sp. P97]MDB6425515.1 DUF1810 domain-containing protein [Curtobacterium sp. 20TX0008]
MSDDPFDLDRFVRAQEGVHEQALAELAAGRKRSHWMWFVFPQLAGLGRSATAQRYAIEGLAEARAFLAHPVLGPRLLEAARTVVDAPARSADDLFGGIDALKARSSATLFARAAEDPAPFRALLDRWFDGTEDPVTVRLLDAT